MVDARRGGNPTVRDEEDEGVNLSNLRVDVNYLLHTITRQGKLLDVLLRKHGASQQRLSPSYLSAMLMDPVANDNEVSRLRREVDRLIEIVALQGTQLEWLTARTMLPPEMEATPHPSKDSSTGATLPLLQDLPFASGNLLSSQLDIIANVIAFCPSNEFLFLAGVSKAWRAVWINAGRPTQTSVRLGASFLLGKVAWVVYDPSFEQAASRHGGIACLAAQVGNFKGLKMAVKVHRIGLQSQDSSLRLMRYTAGKGNLEVLQWLRSQGCPWDESTCSAASGGGHLEVLKWLRAQKCPWDSQTTLAAAKGGHLEVIQWAAAKGCLLHRYTCSSAASAGHLVVLKWAYSLGCQLDPHICRAVARGGHLHVMRWVRERGCRWDKSTTRAAAAGGHLDLLIWAKQRRCPWDKNTCADDAIAGGYQQVAKWIMAQKP